jgi:hypothetical protein
MLEVQGVLEGSVSAVRSAAPRGSDEATEGVPGNDLTVKYGMADMQGD